MTIDVNNKCVLKFCNALIFSENLCFKHFCYLVKNGSPYVTFRMGSFYRKSKLSEINVINIFHDNRSMAKIGIDYNISAVMVWKIKRKKAWNHLKLN